MGSELEELRAMEYDLRMRLRTVLEVVSDQQPGEEFHCGRCGYEFVAMTQCNACEPAETVCSECCWYPIAHGHAQRTRKRSYNMLND